MHLEALEALEVERRLGDSSDDISYVVDFCSIESAKGCGIVLVRLELRPVHLDPRF